jgi:hypothetical protein
MSDIPDSNLSTDHTAFLFIRFGGSPRQIWRVLQFTQYAEQIYSQFKIARHSFENVRQFICRQPECVGGNVGVLLGHGR